MDGIVKPEITIENEHSSESKSLELEVWHEFSINQINQLMKGVYFRFPIQPNNKLIIDIEYLGEVLLRDNFLLKGHHSSFSKVTYPRTDPVFNNINFKTKGSLHRFEANYSGLETIGSLNDSIKKTPYNLKIDNRKFLSQNHFDAVDDLLGVARILDSRLDLESALNTVYLMIMLCKNGKEVEQDRGEDLKYLMSDYKKNKEFIGDCKSISTFTTALISQMGLYTRRVDGYYCELVYGREKIKELENEIREYQQQLDNLLKILNSPNPNENPMVISLNGRLGNYEETLKNTDPDKQYVRETSHIWPEVYIPQNKGHSWFLIDPSAQHIKTFPNKDAQYVVQTRLPNLKGRGKSARIKVIYEKA